jgi:hypothetical protein
MNRKTITAAVILIAAGLMIYCGCDNRGGPMTGITDPGTETYLIEAEAYPVAILIGDSSRIAVLVHEYTSNDHIPGVTVQFVALDFGFITNPTTVTSELTSDGLDSPVYFIADSSGAARIVAKAFDSLNEIVTDTDTITIVVQ